MSGRGRPGTAEGRRRGACRVRRAVGRVAAPLLLVSAAAGAVPADLSPGAARPDEARSDAVGSGAIWSRVTVRQVVAADSRAAAPADSAAIAALLASGRHPAMRHGDLRDVRRVLPALYGAHGWTPVWLDADGRPTPQARALLTVLQGVAGFGLPPAQFEAATLPALAAAVEAAPLGDGAARPSGAGPVPAPPDVAARARFDVALSAVAARLVRALREGRVDPRSAHASLRIPRPPFDAAAAVAELAGTRDMVAAVRVHEPPVVHYERAKHALVRMRALAASGDLVRLPPLPGAPARSVKPGTSWEGLPALVRLLAAFGDLAPVATALDRSGDSLAYAPSVAAAVARFQRRNGLEADSVVGRATWAALTRPLDDRVRALTLTLERWRWLPRTFDAPPLMVNVPGFRLYAFEDTTAGDALLMMDVVVGKAFDTETPIFSDTLTTIAFSPYWDVPESITRAELLPSERRRPGYLARNGFEIVRGQRDDSPVLPITADNLALVARGGARIRQRPGDGNSLGRVKFLFPNAFHVYMHDTPARSLFSRARRDLSHGCIRLAEPVRLAQLLLADDPAWTPARIDSAMALPRPRYVRLRQPRPVFLLYATAMVAPDGEVHFYPDIYGYDDELAARLERGFPFRDDPVRGD